MTDKSSVRRQGQGQGGVVLDDLTALHEMLVGTLTLCMQLDESEVAEHVVDALRVLQDKKRKAGRNAVPN